MPDIGYVYVINHQGRCRILSRNRDVIKNVYKYLIKYCANGLTAHLSLPDIKPSFVIKSTLDSIVKLPLQIPSETSVRSKKEVETKKNSTNKVAPKKEMVEHTNQPDEDAAAIEKKLYPKGYIKYPRYDFF